MLESGYYPFRVVYIDQRQENARVAGANIDGMRTWDGARPELKISGPELDKQVIPAEMLYR